MRSRRRGGVHAQLDVVTGSEVPPYTGDLVSRLRPSYDLRMLRSKSYGTSGWSRGYGIVDHSLRVRREVRSHALVHIDTQRLAYVLAWSIPNPSVVVCYDVLTFRDDNRDPSYDAVRPVVDGLRKWLILRGLENADAIVCPSSFTRKELVSVSPKLSRRTVVIPLGVDPERFAPGDKAEARRRLSLPPERPVVLAVGTESPRKNLERLLRSFSPLVERTKAILVKIGRKREPLRTKLMQLGRSLRIADSLQFVEFATQDELPLYYRAADVFVQPSLHEGFGIPPLEAMACGIPVVASRAASLPEVLGDAALFVDPLEESEITEALLAVMTDHHLAQDLRERGLSRAELYSWASCVSGYRSVFERVSSTAP